MMVWMEIHLLDSSITVWKVYALRGHGLRLRHEGFNTAPSQTFRHPSILIL